MIKADQKVRTNEATSLEELHRVDKQNTARLKEIVLKHGWIAISRFGTEAAKQAFFLVQHADLDIEFQKYCLNMMNHLPDGEVSKRNIAYLTDRVMVAERGIQRYGTQFDDRGGYIVLIPVEDLEHLDELRKQMCMEPMEEYIAIHAKSTGVPVYKSWDDVPTQTSSS